MLNIQNAGKFHNNKLESLVASNNERNSYYYPTRQPTRLQDVNIYEHFRNTK